MNNRILAMLLAIIMIVSIVPVNAFAAECSHTFDANAARVSTNDGNHKVECNKCHVAVSYPCTYGADPVCNYCNYVKEHTCTDVSDWNHLCDYCGEVVHNMTKVEAKAPNHAEGGNIEYWICGTCQNYFEDEAGTKKIEDKNSVNQEKVEHTLEWTITEDTHKYACTGCQYDPVDEEPHELAFDKTTNKMVCAECGYNYDHVCVDTYDGGNHRCDVNGCLADLEEKHTVEWQNNGSGQHFKKCSDTNCYTYQSNNGGALTGWETCVDDNKDCKCDTCGYEFEHQYGNGYSYTDATGHYKVCTVCGAHNNTINHNTFKYEDGKKICSHCGYEYDHVCTDTNGNHSCDECDAELEHDIQWHTSNGQHYGTCKTAGCYRGQANLTGWIACTDEDKDCVCDECGDKKACTWSKELSFNEEYHFRVCTNCGAENTKYEHDFSYGSAVANDNETHTRTCKHKDCNYQVVQNHDDGTKIDHICGSCNAEMVHDWVWDFGPTSHRQKCETCGKLTDYAPHVDEEAPFCKCDDCGADIAHDLTTVERVEAKCGVAGNKGYQVCEKCDALFNLAGGEITEEDIVIPALQHKWWPKGLDLTGTLHTEMCEYCKVISFKSHFDNTGDCMCDYAGCTEAAHEHTIVHVAEKAATCTEEGHQEYWKYAECGKEFADAACTQPLTQKVIYGKTSHNATGWTPTADGTAHEQKCRTCGEVLATEEHDFSTEAPYCADCNMPEGLEFVPEVPATCTVRGVKAHYKSSITQRKYWDAAGTRYISDVNELVSDLLPHAWEVVTSDGVNHVIGCENCTAEYTEACESKDTNCACDVCGILQPGHTMTYVEPVAATCTKNGIIASWYCAKCDKYYTADTLTYLPTVIEPALGHRVTGNWRNDVTENAHSKYCIRCEVKITEEHELEAYDLYSGNLHEWRCSVCDYKKSEKHNYNGDSICDACEHDTAKTVDVDAMDNDRVTVKVETDDEDDTVQEKKASFWKGFVDKIKPSYVGESQSPSAPSSSVNNSLPNGSGVSSSSTGTSQTTTTTNPSAFDAVIDVLWGLLNALGNMLGL